MKITFSGSQLNIRGKIVETPFPIKEAFVDERRVIVLMDPFAEIKAPILDIKEIRHIPKGTNLYCYSADGSVLWKAELPEGDNSEDYYYKISSRFPFVANSFSSYRCEINPVTGKIVGKDFYK